MVVTQLQPITVIFTLPEDSLGGVQEQLAKGAKLAVDVFDRTAQTKIASGELLALDNQIDTTTGTLKVRAVFPNDDLKLFPNQFVNARLLVQTLEGVTLVPLRRHPAKRPDLVRVRRAGWRRAPAHRQAGRHRQRHDAGGLPINPGDVVANSSFDKLQDNDKVNVDNGDHPKGGSPDGSRPDGGTPGSRQGGHRPGGGGHQSGS